MDTRERLMAHGRVGFDRSKEGEVMGDLFRGGRRERQSTAEGTKFRVLDIHTSLKTPHNHSIIVITVDKE